MPPSPSSIEQQRPRIEVRRSSQPPVFDTDGLKESIEHLYRDGVRVFKTLGHSAEPGREEPKTPPFFDVLKDPKLLEKINVADSNSLDEVENAIIAETRATLRALHEKKRALDIGALEALSIQETGSKTEEILRTLKTLDLNEQASKIYEMLHSSEMRSVALQGFTSEELSDLVWEKAKPDLEKACPNFDPWDGKGYQEFLELTQSSPALKERTMLFLSQRFGIMFKEKLLSSEYINELSELSRWLQTETYHEVPLVSEALPLDKLMVVHETFGSIKRIKEILAAFDISTRIPNWIRKTDQAILSITGVDFLKERVNGSINIRLETGLGEETAEIDRDLTLSMEYDAPSKQVQKNLTVKHGAFLLPESLQNQGIAKQVLHDSFQWYFEQKGHGCPVSHVNLLANVGVGGYAWGSYGFGWNKEALIKERVSGKGKSTQPTEAIPTEDHWKEVLVSKLNECTQRAEKFLKYVKNITPEIKLALLAELQEAQSDAQNPDLQDLVHPQRIVSLGKKGPTFVRIENEEGIGGWFVEPANMEGEIVDRMHLGKAMTLGLKWHAQISLQPKTPLERDQLTLLKQRINL